MDFLDPRKKRAHRIRLYLGYGLMAIALAIATFIVVFASYGFDIDRRSGEIIQNGLIIVDAHPEPARILVNGVDKGETSNRLVLPAAQYDIELKRSGYRSWTHRVNLEGSSIEQIGYPFLVPEKLVTKTISELTSVVAMATQSPDRKWLLIHQVNSVNTFNLIDLNSSKHLATSVVLPSDSFTPAPGAHTYEAVEWSNNNKHLLLKHNFVSGSEFIMFNRETPAESINITKIFAPRQFSNVSLRDKKDDQLILFNNIDATLTTANTKTKEVAPLLAGVINYKSFQSDTVVYATNSTNGALGADIRLRQGGKDYLLKTLPNSPNYLLEVVRYGGHTYVACGSPTDGRVYLFKDPANSNAKNSSAAAQPVRVLTVPGARYLSFSPINRYVLVQGGGAFAVYDAETGRQLRYETSLSLAPGEKATWVDGHRLSLNNGEKEYVFDFDGANLQPLVASMPTIGSYYDRDFEAMFTFVPSPTAPDKSSVQRTELKVLLTN